MDELKAQSVTEFCRTHSISRAAFYNLLKAGRGPQIMKIGTRTLISVEAAARWRAQAERVAEARAPDHAA
jgi:predicted DNA-binding transcriptional regulator AlpA